jgi:type II secretory pathway component PulF
MIAGLSVVRIATLSFVALATHQIDANPLLIVIAMVSTAVTTVLGYISGRALSVQLARIRPLRLAADTLKLALPRLGLVYRNLAAAHWCRSFAVLWAAGVTISTALEISSGSASNAHYEAAILKAAICTRNGQSLTQLPQFQV